MDFSFSNISKDGKLLYDILLTVVSVCQSLIFVIMSGRVMFPTTYQVWKNYWNF